MVRLQKTSKPRSHETIKSTHLPVSWSVFFASSKIGRTSLMPTTVALSSLKIAFARLAISRASVVLPQLRRCQSCCDLDEKKNVYPGGPHKMMLPKAPFSIKVERKESDPVKWIWPTNSPSVFGRSRSANGDAACRCDPIVGLLRLTGGIRAEDRGTSPDNSLFWVGLFAVGRWFGCCDANEP
jgi:hypothetical protein